MPSHVTSLESDRCLQHRIFDLATFMVYCFTLFSFISDHAIIKTAKIGDNVATLTVAKEQIWISLICLQTGDKDVTHKVWLKINLGTLSLY